MMESTYQKSGKEALDTLENIYSEFSNLRPTSEMEIKMAVHLEASILGLYGDRHYPEFKNGLYYSAMSLVRRLDKLPTKFKPLVESFKLIDQESLMINQVQVLLTSHLDHITNLINELDDKQKISVSDSLFTAARSFAHIGQDKFKLSEEVFHTSLKSFYQLAYQALEKIENPSDEVQKKKGEFYYNIFPGQYMGELEKADVKVTKEHFDRFCALLDKAGEFNKLPEMKARIANLKFCNSIHYFPLEETDPQKKSENADQAQKYIQESFDRWEEIHKDLSPYTDAQKEIYHKLRCNVSGNYLYLLHQTGRHDEERTKKHIEYCENYYKEHPNDPYCLIHIISLLKTAIKLDKPSQINRWVFEFGKVSERHKHWAATPQYIMDFNNILSFIQKEEEKKKAEEKKSQ